MGAFGFRAFGGFRGSRDFWALNFLWLGFGLLGVLGVPGLLGFWALGVLGVPRLLGFRAVGVFWGFKAFGGLGLGGFRGSSKLIRIL